MTQAFQEQLALTLDGTAFPQLGRPYRGKVRDTYEHGPHLILITTDRLSAFDRVLTTVPFKGQILNTLSNFWFKSTAHIVDNHLVDVVDDNVSIAKKAVGFKIEFVVRGYLTGSLARDYEAQKDPYMLRFGPGLKRDEAFEAPILTPATKAPVGEHDEPISEMDLLRRKLIAPKELAEVKEKALALFRHGQQVAQARGLLLVDTKYEFGVHNGNIILIDEIHTPDSSRFWKADGYRERFLAGLPQVMLDKENIRQWLIHEKKFQGEGPAPVIPDALRIELATKYVTAFDAITGSTFELKPHNTLERVRNSLSTAGLL
jgi:phosphoribosylaminoimidazole-succinocarboxamide synthase